MCSWLYDGHVHADATASLTIYVATQPVDFRMGADGLALLAKETLAHDR